MKVDVDAIWEDELRKKRTERQAEHQLAADRRGYERSRDEARRESAASELLTHRSSVVEAKLLAAVITDADVLTMADELSVDHFADLRHVALFTAVRNLQARGAPVSGVDVMDEIRRTDKQYERHVAEHVEGYVAELLCSQVHNTYGPVGAPIAAWVEHDIATLRGLAERRRSL